MEGVNTVNYGEEYISTAIKIFDVIQIENKDDFISKFIDVLNHFPMAQKAGFGIRIDDLPDHFKNKAMVIAHESQFWAKPVAEDVYEAQIDTTFALYRPFCKGKADRNQKTYRTGGKYVIQHLPWYVDSSNLSEEEREVEEAKSRKINMASMRAMDKCKREGKPILVFPAGTRYRPGKPETKKGVREIDSYLRMFDVMIFISTNGNCLRINPEKPEDMLADLIHPDTVIMAASPVMECKKFRNDILATLEDYEGDKKVVVVDKVMEELDKLHNQYRADE